MPSSPCRMLSLLSALFAVGLATGASAELYKWVDERGVVNYTDKPPPGRSARLIPDTSSSSRWMDRRSCAPDVVSSCSQC